MNILETIGNTPLIELSYFSPRNRTIFAKLEGNNPGGSIKDRIAFSMLEAAEREGILNKDSVIVEPTSGNTGIGLAMVAAAKGYRCLIVMPENMSPERRKIITYYGAELVLTPSCLGISGAIEKANEIVESNPSAYIPDQFTNPANPVIHRLITAPEIENQLSSLPTAFVAGVGTGGTIMGIAQYFKIDKQGETTIVAVEPENSAVLSGRQTGKHGIQGIGAGFVPPMYDSDLIDLIVCVSTDKALEMTRTIGRTMGIGVGISSGANLAAAIQTAEKLSPESIIVTVFPDRADRYLSLI